MDLGSTRGFHLIRLRSSTQHESLRHGYKIYVGKAPDLLHGETRNCTSLLIGPSGNGTAEVMCGAEGYRYIWISAPGTGRVLSLCSVEVVGGCEACVKGKYKTSEGSQGAKESASTIQ